MGRGKETCPFPYLKEESLKEINIDLMEGKKAIVECDDSSYPAIMQVANGEYDILVGFTINPVVIDIGAHVGAFSIWSIKKFHPSHIHCYEPLKRNFGLLQKNIENLPTTVPSFTLTNKSVEAPSNKIYLGSLCSASSSFYNLNEQTTEYEEVENIQAEELPNCDILKVDTEGCEVAILTKYLYTHESKPVLIMFEFHRDRDRIELDRLLNLFGYRLVSGGLFGYELGVFKYVVDSILTTKKG